MPMKVVLLALITNLLIKKGYNSKIVMIWLYFTLGRGAQSNPL